MWRYEWRERLWWGAEEGESGCAVVEGCAVTEEGEVGPALESFGAGERESIVVDWDLFDYVGRRGVRVRVSKEWRGNLDKFVPAER